MNINCPHCGAKIAATRGDFGKTHTCGACNNQFTINSAFICPKDGTVTWLGEDELTLQKKSRKIGVYMLVVAVGFLIWADCVTEPVAAFDIITAFIGGLGSDILTWQGILSLIIGIIGYALCLAGKPMCSHCKEQEGLLDLNSPMGWKLYLETQSDQ